MTTNIKWHEVFPSWSFCDSSKCNKCCSCFLFKFLYFNSHPIFACIGVQDHEPSWKESYTLWPFGLCWQIIKKGTVLDVSAWTSATSRLAYQWRYPWTRSGFCKQSVCVGCFWCLWLLLEFVYCQNLPSANLCLLLECTFCQNLCFLLEFVSSVRVYLLLECVFIQTLCLLLKVVSSVRVCVFYQNVCFVFE